ncbi:M16 family metallopeptidase [Pelagibacterium halotolerans]|uniref:M16 family metallopeptidase n=1 Tax=Pelagibacterium halotolerans TaxID=531813 RepID=UPI00384E82F3
MRAVLSSLITCLCLAPAFGADGTVDRLTSPAGHAFLFMAMPDANAVAIEISWPSDWAYAEDRNPAVPYVGADSILYSGAGDLEAGDFAEQFADTLAEAYLIVGPDEVRGSLLAGPDELAEAARLANLALTDSKFEDQWLRRSRDSLAAGIEQSRAQTANQGWDAARRAILGDGPVYRFLSLPDPSVIDAVTRAEVMRWSDETFTVGDIHVALAGHISPEAAGAAIDILLDGLPMSEDVAEPTLEADFRPRRIVLVRPDAEKATLGFMGALPPTREGGEYEDLAILSVLGGDDSSRLFEAIRTNLRASYGFGAGLSNFTRDTRFFVMAGEVDAKQLARASALVRSTYETMRTQGIDAADIAALKETFSADLGEMLRDPATVAAMILEAELDGSPESRIPELGDELEAVTAAQINDRLRTVYPPADQLIEIVVSADPGIVEDACVIEAISEVDRCL